MTQPLAFRLVETSDADPADRRVDQCERTPKQWPAWSSGAALALLIYAATRVVQVGFLDWLGDPAQSSIKDRLLAWDGGWFIRVATEGYPHGYTYASDGTILGNGLAFFPLYPLLIRALHALGLEAGWAALSVSWAAGAAAAVLLYLLGVQLAARRQAACVPADPDQRRPHRVGLALVVLFCAQPMSVVLSMGYSEALFTALVVGMLYAAGRNAFLVAGVLGLAAGFTRPTGLAAGFALVVAAVLAVRAGRPPARPLIGAVLSLSGVPLYLIWVAYRVGDAGAWFTIQTFGWGTTIDGGASVWDFLATAAHQGTDWVQMSTAVFLITAMLAGIVAVVRRTWPVLLTYGLMCLGLVVGQAGYYHSKPRLLVPVLVILVPPAFAAARAQPHRAALWLTIYAIFGLWYGAYMLTVWPFTI